MHRLIYRFGRFELDAKFRELRSEGARVAIPPKSFDCLLYLIEHRDRAVGRDELISAVWGRLDVSDHLLGQTLRGARLAVGDRATERTTIATVPRFGYRWLAPAEQVLLDLPVPAPAPAAPAERAGEKNGEAETAAANATVARPPRWRLGLLLVTLLSLLGLALYAGRGRDPAPAAADGGPDTYLVLPVALSGSDVENAWLRLGGMEYVAARLREQAGLRVLSSNQALAVAGEDHASAVRSAGDVHRIRTITGASYLLMPRAARSGSAWTFELDVYHGEDLRTYSGSGARALDAAAEASRSFLSAQGIAVAVQRDAQPGFTELLQRIDASFLKGELTQARELIGSAPSTDRERPELRVREARIAFRTGQLEQAEVLFKALATAAPPVASDIRARAHIGLGNVALRRGDYTEGMREQSVAIDLLEADGLRDLLGTAYMERGTLAGSLGQYEAAMSDFGRARTGMERNGDSLALSALDFNVGLVEAYRNRHTAALAAMDRSIAVSQRYGVADMLAAGLHGKAMVQLDLLDNAAALATTQRYVELQTELENPILKRRLASVRVRALAANARLDEATAELDAYLKALPSAREDPQFDLLRAQILYRYGEFAAVVKIGDELVERIRRNADATSEARDPRAVAPLLVSAAARAGDAAAGRRWFDLLGSVGEADEANWQNAYGLALARAELAAPAAAAERDFAQALALADQHGHSDLIVESALAQIRYLLADRRDPGRAVGIAGRLASFADRDYRVALATAAAYRANGDGVLADAALAKAIAAGGQRAAALPF